MTYFLVTWLPDTPQTTEHQIYLRIDRNKYESLLLDSTDGIDLDGKTYCIVDKFFFTESNMVYNSRFVILKIKTT